MARLWSYSIRYCPFLIDLWFNPICYVCFMPICGFIQFDMSAFLMWFYAICYVCFLPICGFMQLALIFHV
ncbi:hypothetical protein BY996DRAFT_8126734, partial [Phakopsora pachyrhizi]